MGRPMVGTDTPFSMAMDATPPVTPVTGSGGKEAADAGDGAGAAEFMVKVAVRPTGMPPAGE
jgi:hypothetical protein